MIYMSTYCTSYCNGYHRLSDGKPVGHQCYILPPEALRLEREGKVEEAIKLLRAAKIVSRGVRA